MRLKKALFWSAAALGSVATAAAVQSFLPRRFDSYAWQANEPSAAPVDTSLFPPIEVLFLRCGSITLPDMIAARGSFSFASSVLAYSAVLIRHPRATFLYDTGLCSSIHSFLSTQSFLFRKTLGNFAYEQSLRSHLQGLGIRRDQLDFALLSHLHWDHVSGIPDIPGVPLKINRVEYEAARLGLLDERGGLVRHLLGDNPREFFDLTGPSYAGFRTSYDLFGDGSIVLVPLPGHTAGNTGMFINGSNGPRVLLLGDAAWTLQNYSRPAPIHPLLWSAITSDDATAWQTLIELHRFWLRHPDIALIAMHDAATQEAFTRMSGERDAGDAA